MGQLPKCNTENKNLKANLLDQNMNELAKKKNYLECKWNQPQEEFGVMNGYKNAPKPGTVYADVRDIKVSYLIINNDLSWLKLEGWSVWRYFEMA